MEHAWMRALLAAIVLILAASSLGQSFAQSDTKADSAPPTAVPPWEGAGVFVFDAYVLDLTKHAEKFEPMTVTDLVDCTNEKFFCLSSRLNGYMLGYTHFVIPRRCQDIWQIKKGDAWSLNGVSTEVLNVWVNPDKTPFSLHFTLPEKIYYLGSASNPSWVYEYWPNGGIVAVYFVPFKDAVSEARHSLTGNLSRNSRWRRSLVTLDSLARCSWGN